MLQWLLRNVIGKIAAIPVRHISALRGSHASPPGHAGGSAPRILRQQAATGFGRDHHFQAIHDRAGFQKNVPVAPYEYVEPYIRRVTQGDYGALLSDPKVHMFAMTSGTTAARKFIPVTNDYLNDYRRGWNLWGLKVFRDHREVRFRQIVQWSGDWQEFSTPAGVPCGSVTGLTAAMQMRIVRWLYCVPGSVGKIKDAAAKNYLALRLSMARRVGMITAANPSTLVNLARTGDQEKESLLRDLARRHAQQPFRHSRRHPSRSEPRLRKRYPEKVRLFEDIIRRTGTLYPKDFWPAGAIIGNWMGGSVGVICAISPNTTARRRSATSASLPVKAA